MKLSDVSWIAVLATLLAVAGVAGAVVGYLHGDQNLVEVAGVVVVAGLAGAVLALRER